MNTKDIPKIILHLHLDGSLDLDLASTWLKEDGYHYKKSDLKEKMSIQENCHSLNDYLEKFTLPCQLLNTKERLTEATYNLLKKLAHQNVLYAEIRFAPLKHQNKNLNLDEVVTAVITGLKKASEKHKIKGSIILCCMRNSSKEDNLKIVNLAKKYHNKGVSAIDLAGAESLYKTEDFEYIFTEAKKLNIPYTIHAGEADGPSSINSALNFGTKRLGHGIKCLEEETTLKHIIKEKILLEICYTSNYQTEAVKGKHPLENLYQKNIPISLNTDNDTVSNINIITEYDKILAETSLTINDIIKCNYNSIDYLFTTEQTKKELKEKYKKKLAEISN